MTVKRIVTNIHTADPGPAKCFYGDILGLDLLMDLGWIVTWGLKEKITAQISFATQGGSNTPVPDISIEVDDIYPVFEKMQKAGFAVEYGPVEEPWGVRRFYARDPFDRLVNILDHQ